MVSFTSIVLYIKSINLDVGTLVTMCKLDPKNIALAFNELIKLDALDKENNKLT